MKEQIGVDKYTQEIELLESQIKRLHDYITKTEGDNTRLKRLDERLYREKLDLRITISNLKDLIKYKEVKSMYRLKILEKQLELLESLDK